MRFFQPSFMGESGVVIFFFLFFFFCSFSFLSFVVDVMRDEGPTFVAMALILCFSRLQIEHTSIRIFRKPCTM